MNISLWLEFLGKNHLYGVSMEFYEQYGLTQILVKLGFGKYGMEWFSSWENYLVKLGFERIWYGMVFKLGKPPNTTCLKY